MSTAFSLSRKSRHLIAGVAGAALLVLLQACAQSTPPAEVPPTEVIDASVQSDAPPTIQPTLAEVLDNQPEATKARFAYRNPGETLTYLGVEPGMTVVEALPGGGWYSKLLLEYLGPQGHLVGVNYPMDLWPNFGFADDAFIARMATWSTDWPTQAETWRTPGSARVSAFVFGELPDADHNSADRVLLIRALHNLARFDAKYLQTAIRNSFDILKPGGVLGVVQHEARPDMPDSWANGSNGYLKRTFVIEQIEAAGFEFVGASEINQNDLDIPTTEDFVWRLPPSLRTSQDDEALRQKYQTIGESNRMTLKFVKPSA